MKVALCLSGHFRTFLLCKDSLLSNFILEYNPDIFIHTWDNLGFGRNGTNGGNNISKWTGNDMEIINTNSVYGNSRIEFYRNSPALDDIYKCLNPKEIVIETYEDVEKDILELSANINNKFPYDYPVNIISLWRKKYLCNELKRQYEINNNFKYDIVVSTRPDIQYFTKLCLTLNNKIITPSAQSYGAISDLFGYSSSNDMDIYCSLYTKIREYNDQHVHFNPHVLLVHHLKVHGLEFIIDPQLNIDVNKNLSAY